MKALVLTYHAVERADGPLFVDPDTFAAHLDTIIETDARVVSVSQLANDLRRGSVSPRTVAITFDDGIASVARVAAPLLAERGLVATVFCVAGHLGGYSDWTSARSTAPTLELARAEELAELTGEGWEIGCHGMAHVPLRSCPPEVVERELTVAKTVLGEATGAMIRAYAYPYGAGPSAAARREVEREYESAWTTTIGLVSPAADPYRLPRVDAHYLRHPALLRAAISGKLARYLRIRRMGASARRAFRNDFMWDGAT